MAGPFRRFVVPPFLLLFEFFVSGKACRKASNAGFPVVNIVAGVVMGSDEDDRTLTTGHWGSKTLWTTVL